MTTFLVQTFQCELGSVQSAESERLAQPLAGGESALRVCAALLGAGPQASPMHPHHLPGMSKNLLYLGLNQIVHNNYFHQVCAEAVS